ncbi:carboxymuconolactone decarboxylase family protein [Nonomuraea antimicrobica]
MTERMDLGTLAGEAYKGMARLDGFVAHSTLPKPLLELVRLRASQINGCAYCVDLHSSDAKAAGRATPACTPSPSGARRPSSPSRNARRLPSPRRPPGCPRMTSPTRSGRRPPGASRSRSWPRWWWPWRRSTPGTGWRPRRG